MPDLSRSYVPIAIVGVFIIVIALLWRSALGATLDGSLPGNDDYLRLVQIRDWINGQPWGDMTQYRMYPGDPIQMHWTRATDVGVVSLILLFDIFMPYSAAETAALIVWPMLLLGGLLLGLITLARQISPRPGYVFAVLVLFVFAFQTTMQFRPGRIDHHGLQIMLAVWIAALFLQSDKRPHKMAIAGMLSVFSLYVGMESLPLVLAVVISAVLLWVFKDTSAGVRLKYFGGGLIGGSILWLALSPGGFTTSPVCDAWSPVYALAMILIGCVSLAIPYLTKYARTWYVRFSLAGILGGAAGAIVLALFPDCISGPYARLDPLLKEVWLSTIREARPIWVLAKSQPASAVFILTFPLIALIFIAAKLRSGALVIDPKLRSIVIMFGLLFAAGVIQNRILAFASVFALCIAALALLEIIDASQRISSDVLRTLVRAIAILFFIPFIPTSFVTKAFGQTGSAGKSYVSISGCFDDAAIKTLNTVPAGKIMNVSDLGAATLKHSPHAITTGPYHRNEAGLMASIQTFTSTTPDAVASLRRDGFDYVMVCDGLAENDHLLQKAPSGFLQALLGDEDIEYLAPVQTGSDHLKLWKVAP